MNTSFHVVCFQNASGDSFGESASTMQAAVKLAAQLTAEGYNVTHIKDSPRYGRMFDRFGKPL